MSELILDSLVVAHKSSQLFIVERLHLVQGKIYLITGENGEGKTTFLKSILKKFPERSIGYLSARHLGLMPYLTARENLQLYLNEEKINQLIKKYHKISFLNELLDKKIENASEGMRQFLSLAIMLEINFEIFLLDEPFNSLSESVKEVFEDILLELKKTKIVVMANPKFNLIKIENFNEIQIKDRNIHVV